MKQQYDHLKSFKRILKNTNISQRPIISIINKINDNEDGVSTPLEHYNIAEFMLAYYIIPFGYDFMEKQIIENESNKDILEQIPNLFSLCKIIESREVDEFYTFLSQIGFEHHFEVFQKQLPLFRLDQIDDFIIENKGIEDFNLKLSILLSYYLKDYSDESEVSSTFHSLYNLFSKAKINHIDEIEKYVKSFLKSEYDITRLDFKYYPADGVFPLPCNYITFLDGFIDVKHPDSRIIERIKFDRSKSAFEIISSYMKKKLPYVYVEAKKNRIIRIHHPELMDEVINILDIISSSPEMLITPKKRYQFTQMTDHELRKEIKRFKSAYLDYLIDVQLDTFRLIYCIERKCHYNAKESIEDSFIFTIKHRKRIIVVLENIDINRSTIVFYIKPLHYDRAISKIHDYFASNIINKRLLIVNNDIRFKNSGITKLKRILHTDFNSWKNKIQNL